MTPDPRSLAAGTDLLAEARTRQSRGDLAGAQAMCWQVLLGDPKHFEALHLLGIGKCRQGHQAEGSWFIARALEQRPNDAAARHNLAMAFVELGRPGEALYRLDAFLARRPDDAPAWVSRGDVLQAVGRHAEAIKSYSRAHALQPDMPDALSSMGAALLATGQAARAIELCSQALARVTDRASALVTIGRAQEELGERQAACDSYAAACTAAPEAARPQWLRAMATLPVVAADEAEIAASRPAFAAALGAVEAWYAADPTGGRDLLEHTWPFYLAYQPHNNKALLTMYGRLRARLLERWRQTQALPEHSPVSQTGPVRVGVVSAELRNHSVWWAITRGWFAHFDPVRIALHGFHLGRNSDGETEFARSRAASLTSGQRSLADWVRAIASIQPEVLIYPAIGIDAMTANLAALRLAPVQLAAWGHPETTGLPTIDGYLSAEAFEPPDAQEAYTETLLPLPRLGVSYSPAPTVPEAPDLAALGLDPCRPIVLCPGTPFKYTPFSDTILAAIVQRAANAQLVFFRSRKMAGRSACMSGRLAARFAAEGLDFSAHVRFIPFLEANGFHGLLRQADLCLDTIGFSGFNTAMQVLGAGTPLVAFEGRFMRGRLASGILRQMGLAELIATDAAEFVSIATRVITDAAWRDQLRRRIFAALPGLYDDRAAVQALEDKIVWLARGATA